MIVALAHGAAPSSFWRRFAQVGRERPRMAASTAAVDKQPASQISHLPRNFLSSKFSDIPCWSERDWRAEPKPYLDFTANSCAGRHECLKKMHGRRPLVQVSACLDLRAAVGRFSSARNSRGG